MEGIARKALGDMRLDDIIGDYQSTTLKHFDGNTRNIFYTEQEALFPEGEKIISVTDVDGYIMQANSTFVLMSGYSKEELLGMPHYILRHPDMPRVAFTGLWERLNKTGHWEGYVKNLRKDGGFYWVHATVFPLRRNGETIGYTSSRSPAPRENVEACSTLYKQLLAKEQNG